MERYAIEVDTHTHSVLSGHAWSTVRENLAQAKSIGLRGLCITEHSCAVPGAGPEFMPFSLAMIPKEQDGIRVYYGLEADIVSVDGSLRPSDQYLSMLEFCIASMHIVSSEMQRTKEVCTDAYLCAMENPYISAIGHADRISFPCDLETVVRRALSRGMVMELNNGSLIPSRIAGRENVVRIAKLCMQYDVPVCIGSDAHYHTMIGDVGLAFDMLRELAFPQELIINAKKERFDRFIENRRTAIKNEYGSGDYAKADKKRIHGDQDSGL
ncbi:putative phosphatase YcdX [bioreactor metagenome]|uniref:Putative phosphatase YcdX n=1 Tax=bioreactor metagenome TaxID=1076179 RepID=A0A644YVJ0_9ZZZZ